MLSAKRDLTREATGHTQESISSPNYQAKDRANAYAATGSGDKKALREEGHHGWDKAGKP